jgi:hypothetical protein
VSPESIVALTDRIAELEQLVRLLVILLALTSAALLAGGTFAMLWLRAQHEQIRRGLEDLAEDHDSLEESIHAAELSRALSRRDQGVLH